VGVVSGSPLVGRDLPLRQVVRALDDAGAGMGRLVLISGEAGVGKTSLATEALAEAERRGARVATGTCWDGAGTPGLWPWIQLLRALCSAVGPEGWSRASGSGQEALDRLIQADPQLATSAVEFHLFDAVLQLLVHLTSEAPVALVVDDLQWADSASVQLLEFVQRHAGNLCLLIIGTYRADELANASHPRRDAVAELARTARTIALGGLDNEAIRQLRDRLGAPTTVAEAEHLRRLTGGNPFFVIESTAYPSPIESLGVRRAIEHRIDALGARERAVLSVASIVGRVVPDAVVHAVVGDDSAAALAVITHAGLMDAAKGTHAFVHDLVRETIVAQLTDDERRSLHAAIVRATSDEAVAITLLPAQIAWQAAQAVPEIPAAYAVELLEAAALDASRRQTHEAAGRHLEAAAALAADRTDAARLTLASGQAYLRAGELNLARDRFEGLLDQSPEVRARALLGLHSLGELAASSDTTDVVRGLDDVDHALGPDADAALRAEVLAARSRSRTHLLAADRSEAKHMAAHALELARTAGHEPTLASCLLAHHDAIWEPGSEQARLSLASELAALGRTLHDPAVEAQGLLLEMVAELELGDPTFRQTHRRFDAIAEASRSPRLRFWAASRRGTVALLDARFGLAIEEIDAARELGNRIGEADAVSVWCDQRWQAARHTGDTETIAELSQVLREKGDPHWVLYEALLAADAGDVERAERWAPQVEIFEEQWPRWAARLWLTFLAHLAVIRGDHLALESLIARLTPEADRWAVLGGAVIVDGPMSIWLGRLEAARGENARAAGWFAHAEASARRLGSTLWALEASAERLRTRHVEGKATTAELASVIDRARAAGLRPIVERLQQLAVSRTPNVFRLDLDVWTLAWDGFEIRMPDAKGLRDLHTLVANPGVEISAVDLASGGLAVVATSPPVLDAQAKGAYRRRLDELDEALDRAALRNRDDRVRELEIEREALLDELRRATGLGGRDRRVDDAAEKMRKTVTARIRDSLRRLDDRHPTLATHLRESLRTGAHCSYAPAQPATWEL
jgi:AAA ATPase domain